jgi:hypothetical protein
MQKQKSKPDVEVKEIFRSRDIVFGRIGEIYFLKDANEMERRVYLTAKDLERMFSAARLDSVQEFLKS